jgi:hypothetical protein
MQNRITLFLTMIISAATLTGFASAEQKQKIAKSRPQAEKQMPDEKQKEAEIPFACSLTALTAAERAHHSDLSKELHSAVKDIRELDNGYAFQFSGEAKTISMVAEWISLERLCCPFFTFQLEVASEGKPMWLRMTGREGVKDFMRTEFGIK